MYCNSMLNAVSLEKIYLKYKKELDEYYKTKLSETIGQSSNINEKLVLPEYYDKVKFEFSDQNNKNEFIFPRIDIYKSSLVKNKFGNFLGPFYIRIKQR